MMVETNGVETGSTIGKEGGVAIGDALSHNRTLEVLCMESL